MRRTGGFCGAWAGVVLCLGSAWAHVAPGVGISDGMVLQRGTKARVYGTASSGERVTVRFHGQTASTTTGGDGRWRVELGPMEAGGPWPMTISGGNSLDFREVYVGEVWFCSGQSNMEWPLFRCTGGVEAAKEPLPRVRFLNYNAGRLTWSAATGADALSFSGLGYFFGRALSRSLGVPVGLISSSVGGTPIEAWTPGEALMKAPCAPEIRKLYEASEAGYRKALSAGGANRPPERPHGPGYLWESKVRLFTQYTLGGILWYQGEANVRRAEEYEAVLPLLISSWRAAWGRGDLPFLLVQLARHNRPLDPLAVDRSSVEQAHWTLLREAQLHALSVPGTGMAVSFDVSDGDIHPPDKAPVGERLALIARALGGEKVEFSGPVFRQAGREGAKVILSFDHAAGLRAKDGALRDFLLAPVGGDFRVAQASTVGDTVVLSAEGLTGPVEVRYGWSEFPVGNLYNDAGLPASPFRTGPIE